MLQFSKQHFERHFLAENVFWFTRMKFDPNGSNNKKVSIGVSNGLVPPGYKQLPEPMMTQFIDAYVSIRPQWVCMFSYAVSVSWWRHQMEAFSALLAICAGNSPVPGEFPTQRPVTQSFDVYFDLRLNRRLCKQSWGWWFETLLCPLWRHSNDITDGAQCIRHRYISVVQSHCLK